jgi:hypothetical protein
MSDALARARELIDTLREPLSTIILGTATPDGTPEASVAAAAAARLHRLRICAGVQCIQSDQRCGKRIAVERRSVPVRADQTGYRL